jgi:hypothetical protein
MTKAHRQRLATVRAIALLAEPLRPVDHQHQLVDEIEAGDENAPENFPQVSRASHYS